MIEDETKTKIVGTVLIVLIIGLPTFILLSTESVDTTEVAFNRNTITGKIDFSKIYTTGFYWNGLFNSFIRFDTTLKTIEFTEDMVLRSRTSDGLAISLDISFQYRIQPDMIQYIYLDYLTAYEDIYITVARDNIRDTVSLFTAIQFFNNRTFIGLTMEEALRDSLNNTYADVENLQLRDVDLPDSFEQALEDVEVARQDYEVALREQEAAMIRAETEVLLASSAAQVQIIGAEASAEAYIITMTAQAEALNITLNTESEALYALGQTLGLNTTELLTYLWIKAITEHTDAMLIIGESTPEILVTTD